MVKFLHAADLHLDSPLRMLERYDGAPVEELRLATRRAVIRLVDLAIAEKVDFVVVSGDLYDGDWKDYNTGLFFVAQMARLADARIPCFLIAGNHDAASKMTRSLRLPESVQFFPADKPATFTLDDLGVALHGQSFAKPAVTADLSLTYPEPTRGLLNVGLLHTCAEGREGHERYAPCKVENLRLKGYDYWALGHIHRREILAREPLILFPGNTQGRHIRETGPKGAVIVTLRDGDAPAAKFVPLAVVRWEESILELTTGDSEDDAFEQIQKKMKALHDQVDGLPSVVRFRLESEKFSVDQWEIEKDRWTNETRALARQVTNSAMWIESVRHTPRGIQTDTIDHDGSAAGLVLRELELLTNDEEQILALASPLRELIRRLPAELRGEEGFDVSDPQWIRHALAEVAPLLVDRLGSRREGASS